jgi:hypothetical protein
MEEMIGRKNHIKKSEENKINLKLSFQNEFNAMIKKERNNRFFNPEFFSGDMRCKIIHRILKPLNERVKYKESTLHLAISIMDVFLSKNKIDAKLMASVGIVAFSLASKFNEVYYIGINPNFFYEMKETLYLDLFPYLEKAILCSVNFNLNIITPIHYLDLFMQYQILDPSTKESESLTIKLFKMNLFSIILDLTSDYKSNKFSSLIIFLSSLVIYMNKVNSSLNNCQYLNKVIKLFQNEIQYLLNLKNNWKINKTDKKFSILLAFSN